MDAKMLINGEFCGSSSGNVLVSYNPYDGTAVGSYPSASYEDVERALNSAREGFDAYRGISVNDRIRLLNNAAQIFSEHEEELAQLQCREMGKPINMCRGEVAEIAPLFRSCAAVLTHQTGNRYPDNNAAGSLGDIAFTIDEPLGVVVCIGPFNFPVSTLTFKTAPALASGNAVIIKAPSDVAVLVLRYAELLNEAGFPKGVVQAISGPGGAVGDWLVDTPLVDAVGLTGSTAVGSHIQQLSAKYFHRTLLELGGNDAFLIAPDADIATAVGESMCRAVNNGQVCCTSKRFLVHNTIKQAYLDGLVQAVSGLKLGDPSDPSVDMGPVVNERAAKEIVAQIEHTIEQGSELLYGGTREGALVQPTVLNCSKDADVAKDLEIFGPVWSVIGYDTIDEAVEIANQSIYGLNGGVLAGDLSEGIRIASRISAGTVVANGGSLWRRDTAPFGGYKSSGLGREGVTDLMREYSQRKTIVIKNI